MFDLSKLLLSSIFLMMFISASHAEDAECIEAKKVVQKFIELEKQGLTASYDYPESIKSLLIGVEGLWPHDVGTDILRVMREGSTATIISCRKAVYEIDENLQFKIEPIEIVVQHEIVGNVWGAGRIDGCLYNTIQKTNASLWLVKKNDTYKIVSERLYYPISTWHGAKQIFDSFNVSSKDNLDSANYRECRDDE